MANRVRDHPVHVPIYRSPGFATLLVSIAGDLSHSRDPIALSKLTLNDCRC